MEECIGVVEVVGIILLVSCFGCFTVSVQVFGIVKKDGEYDQRSNHRTVSTLFLSQVIV